MNYRLSSKLAYLILIILCLIMAAFILVKPNNQKEDNTLTPPVLVTKFIKPDYVRGLYLTAHSAGDKDYRKDLLLKLTDSRINSVVVDIKDYSGYILYDSNLKEVNDINGKNVQMAEVEKIIKEFHDHNIYVIARQTVFQDPVLAKAKPELAFHTYDGNLWHDKSGLAWLDPTKQEVWKYNLAIAKEALSLGFDEIQFDYMRYPSDGNLSILKYNISEGKTRSEILGDFFKYLADNLRAEQISVDLFGLVTDHVKDGSDMYIGQKLEIAADYFDYISPMMYPSHYPENYLGFTNPADYPGQVVSYGLKFSKDLMSQKPAKLRPWLQAFSLGAVYDENKINAQIAAVENVTSTEGWLLWNARNVYADYIFTSTPTGQ